MNPAILKLRDVCRRISSEHYDPNGPLPHEAVAILPVAVQRIDELEKALAAELEKADRNIEAHDGLVQQIADLQQEKDLAGEHIDNLHVIMADQREKLQQLQAFREGVVKALDYNPITAHLRADKDLLQEIAELEKLHHRIEAKIVSRPKPAPREGCVQYRIRERQRELTLQAHKYMINGPAGLHFEIQGTDDLIKVVKALLTATNLRRPLQVSIQEAI